MEGENVIDVRRGDVFYCRLDKNRPCVIVSNNCINFKNHNVIVVPLSSHIKRTDLASHTVLKQCIKGRKVMSMTEFFYTVDRNELGNYICSLTPGDMSSIDWSIKKVLGL